MTAPVLWWIATGILVALELASGTFYLLMLALGAAAGAIAAHVGAGTSAQLASAAVVGGVAIVACYLVRKRALPHEPAPSADRNINLDIGATLRVERWNDDATAQVRYRGAIWSAVCRGAAAPMPGTYRIVEIIGSRLILEPAADA